MIGEVDFDSNFYELVFYALVTYNYFSCVYAPRVVY